MNCNLKKLGRRFQVLMLCLQKSLYVSGFCPPNPPLSQHFASVSVSVNVGLGEGSESFYG